MASLCQGSCSSERGEGARRGCCSSSVVKHTHTHERHTHTHSHSKPSVPTSSRGLRRPPKISEPPKTHLRKPPNEHPPILPAAAAAQRAPNKRCLYGSTALRHASTGEGALLSGDHVDEYMYVAVREGGGEGGREGRREGGARTTFGSKRATPRGSPLDCIDSFLQQQRARRRALPQETKQRYRGANFRRLLAVFSGFRWIRGSVSGTPGGSSEVPRPQRSPEGRPGPLAGMVANDLQTPDEGRTREKINRHRSGTCARRKAVSKTTFN